MWREKVKFTSIICVETYVVHNHINLCISNSFFEFFLIATTVTFLPPKSQHQYIDTSYSAITGHNNKIHSSKLLK